MPNSELINKRVTNLTSKEMIVRIPFFVPVGSDKELIRKSVFEAANSVPYTLNDGRRRAPQVRMTDFGDKVLNFELVVWIKPGLGMRRGRIRSAYLWAIDDTLAKIRRSS